MLTAAKPYPILGSLASFPTCWVPTISALILTYRCLEENNGDEFYDDFEELWGMWSPSQVPVGAEDEDSLSSYRFPLLKTFMSPVWV
jgi:hypothetical protein